MLQDSVLTDQYQESIEQALNHVKNSGYNDIRARCEGYDNPSTLKMKDSSEGFTPDITASKFGGKYYFEIANRDEKQVEVISKWKLLSTLATMKQGELKIFVPYGSMKYASEIVKNKDIKAELIKL